MMYHSGSNGNFGLVTIRADQATDRAALRRVAQRDSRPIPRGELLVAEVDGEIQAAIALATGEVIADPFRPTAELVRMLGLRRDELRVDLRGPIGAQPSEPSRLASAEC
jgi:hypothetical protein